MKQTHALLLTVAISATVSTAALSAAERLVEQTGRRNFITREISWDGGESLILGAPASLQYIQTSEAPGKVVITGPARSVNTFKVERGVLDDEVFRTSDQVSVVVYAPSIKRFSAKGGDTIDIRDFDQDELDIHVSGRADIKASGRAGTVELQMEGVGWADLSQLEARGAQIDVSGARNAIVSATEWAKLSGNGKVILVKRPQQLSSELWGAGRVFVTAPHEQPVEARVAAD